MQQKISHKNIKNLDDDKLLYLFINKGDTAYLGELYARYIHLVYGLCLKYFKEVEKSKDAVIEIYEKVQLDIHKYEVKNFKSWLYVVSKNYCLMELRKNKPGNLSLSPDDDELSRFMEKEVELHPIDRKNEEETEKALADCIERLKIEQKKCIRLFYFDDKCYREIAEILKTKEKKIKSFIQNGKRNLKICMERKNEYK